MSKILQVGAAKLSISPAPDMLPILLAFSGDNYEAVRDGEGLSVRAIAVDNGEERFLFEACELPGFPVPDMVNTLLSEKYGFDKKHMLLTGTHNHAAPFPVDPPKPGEYNKYNLKEDDSDNAKRWTKLVIDRCVEAAGLALENLRPVKMGYGEDKSYININRDELFDDGYWMQGANWEGVSDKTVAAVTFTDYDGRLVAAILNYAVHDVLNFLAKDADGKVKITCGIPGIASNWLEEYFGNNSVVLWQSGAAGNQNPVAACLHRYDKNGTMYFADDDVPGASYVAAKRVGEQHAVDCLRAIKKAEPTRDWVKLTTEETIVYLPGQKFPEGVDPLYHRLMVDNLLVSHGYYKPGEKYEKHLVDMIPTDERVPMRAQLVVLGDVAFYGVACELYNEIGLECKAASPLKHTMVTTHIGDKGVGYVLDDASKGHKVFQSYGRIREGESNALVVSGMLKMFGDIITKQE